MQKYAYCLFVTALILREPFKNYLADFFSVKGVPPPPLPP